MSETTLTTLRARHLAEERELVRAALEAADGFVDRAARALDVHPQTLRRVLDRHKGLADEAEALKKAKGYEGGRPTPPTQEAEASSPARGGGKGSRSGAPGRGAKRARAGARDN